VTLKDRCDAIEWLLLDVDGVLSEGSITYTEQKVELKHFHVRDGAGIKMWQYCGKRVGIISGRSSVVTEIRAKELGINPVVQGEPNKLPGYRQFLAEAKAEPRHVCFVGDDLPDAAILRHCGLAVAVADAWPGLQRVDNYTTQCAGGRGAVREVIELILRCQGKWQEYIKRYFESTLS
jgi:YrbI family 3-deoxy-D-manno-octulosonate 8-phosphate phosphatase